MANYSDFYESTFGPINIGDTVKIYKDGDTFEGQLLYKNEYFITVQLPYYKEGFSMPDFYTGHAKLITNADEAEIIAEKSDETEQDDG